RDSGSADTQCQSWPQSRCHTHADARGTRGAAQHSQRSGCTRCGSSLYVGPDPAYGRRPDAAPGQCQQLVDACFGTTAQETHICRCRSWITRV
ncbi:hypothetical protein H4R99_007003, partial [Coemansia sp. RSA 1722]